MLHEPGANAAAATQLAFLFHPFLLGNCAAKTSTGLQNLVLALFLLFMLKKWKLSATLTLALVTR